MMDGQSAIDWAIINALRANDDLMDEIEGDDDVPKLWKGAAPPKLVGAYPYVLFSYASGGLRNDAPYDAIDMEMLITSIALTSGQARELAGMIEDSLKNKVLTYDNGWVSNSTVRQTDFFSRQVTVQQAQYHQVGAYYRFRASKAKE